MRSLNPRNIFLLSTCTGLVIIFTYTFLEADNLKNQKYPEINRNKIILSWTEFYGIEKFLVPSFDDLNCSVNTCLVTENRNLLTESDAVVIHLFNVNPKDLPRKRRNCKFVLLSFESPVSVPIEKEISAEIHSLIDWTASYRTDSDIYAHYGMIKKINHPSIQTKPRRSLDFNKKGSIAWTVSHCNTTSKREKVVIELRNHGVRIDEYGECATGNKALKDKSRDEGYAYLAERYKFYISFENSLCRDYATEKVFQPMYYGMVPVVFGGADYKKILPDNSYIDILDFSSMEELANYLKIVGTNEELYLKFHLWRESYYVAVHESTNNFFCELCEKLHNPALINKEARNDDLLRRWSIDNDCFKPTFSEQRLNLSYARQRRKQLYSSGI